MDATRLLIQLILSCVRANINSFVASNIVDFLKLSWLC